MSASPSDGSQSEAGPSNAGSGSGSTDKIEVESLDGERRNLTVMFCDVVGSTELSERLDPEELRDLLNDYLENWANVIRQFEGYIAKYLGDGILVYFGYPRAHEDDAVRAVRTGLGIVEGMAELNARHRRVNRRGLEVRVGIHTGLVVAGQFGDGASGEARGIVGKTPNIAARLQGVADPDSVVISDSTYELVRGYFHVEDLGIPTLKGVSEPLRVFRVSKETGARRRFDLSRSAGLIPLVGRGKEVDLLLDRWESARGGGGQVVLISGEAGIGKSRIVENLKVLLEEEEINRIEYQCSPYHERSAFFPVIDLLQNQLEFEKGDPKEEKISKLNAFVDRMNFETVEILPVLSDLLELRASSGARASHAHLTKDREKSLNALLKLFLHLAEDRALLFVVEDLQWIDPSTLELVNLIVDQCETEKILAVFSTRPGFQPPWKNRNHVASITLDRLAGEEVREMVGRITSGKKMPPEVMDQILTKTDGVPLFVEELTRMVIESSLLEEEDGEFRLRRPLPPLAIPTTLQDSLMARLDRLAAVREIAQLAATVGREFRFDLLREIAPINEERLRHVLSQLVDADILFKRGQDSKPIYTFRHTLIQETAYQALLKSKRQAFHHRIAEALENAFPEAAESQPEIVARHFTEAGILEKAVDYWESAGDRANRHSWHQEAIVHMTEGLGLLATLPNDMERAKQGLRIRLGLGVALIATEGYASPAVEKTYTQARELCQQIGRGPELFSALWGLYSYYSVRGDHATAVELARLLAGLAHHLEEASLSVEAHLAMAFTSFYLGDFESARPHIEETIRISETEDLTEHPFVYGQAPGMTARCIKAWTDALSGERKQARKACREAVELAEGAGHPHSEAMACFFASMCFQFLGQPQEASRRSDQAQAIAIEHGFPFWRATSLVLSGWAISKTDRSEVCIDRMYEGLEELETLGAGLWRSYFLGLLADAYLEVGREDAAAPALDEALSISKEREEHFYVPELLRLKGRLLAGRPATREEGLSLLKTSLMTSRRWGARLFELRSAIDWVNESKRVEEKTESMRSLETVLESFPKEEELAEVEMARALLSAGVKEKVEARLGEKGAKA